MKTISAQRFFSSAKRNWALPLTLSAVTMIMAQAQAQESAPPDPADFASSHPSFSNYWYQGLAEMSRYSLEQSRYGDTHPGEAVLIYVTEDFLADEQVKYEYGDSSQAVGVIKLNSYRRFYTGIYPYTLMTSIFTPVLPALTPTLKVAFSIQEWCGTSFSQLNLQNREYRHELRSYFQAEGDRVETVPLVQLEDALWTQLRHDPTALPVSEISVLPSMQYLRMMHMPAVPYTAETRLETSSDTFLGDRSVYVYTLDYIDLPRRLRIYIEIPFPHRVLAWEESYRSSTQAEDDAYDTRAVMTHSIMLDYWEHNHLRDAHWRETLGLTQ